MAAFECDRCGKCCVSLGPHITIERQLNERDYFCHCNIDNTIFLVCVDTVYREEIADEFADAGSDHPSHGNKSCRFLRKNQDGEGTVCAIYASRPKVCRDFRCYHMLIRNREGTVCGRVIGKNTLRTEDPALEKLWHEQVAGIPYGNTALWLTQVTGILVDHDYCADPVE